MGVSIRKSKMVSFRLAPADYIRFREICATRGVQSISDLARLAMENFAASESRADPLSSELRDLRTQIRSMELELDRISQIVESRKVAAQA
jgi:hypothetical protein